MQGLIRTNDCNVCTNYTGDESVKWEFGCRFAFDSVTIFVVHVNIFFKNNTLHYVKV